MEFNLIKQYFQSRAQKRQDVLLGIGDDCALLVSPSNHVLAMSTDTLVAGVHYFPGTNPVAIGHKALAVSLSDLAAMGAEPAWVLLSLSLQEVNESWLADFCDGFFALADHYRLALVGGNMTSGMESVTTQVTGFLPVGAELRRDAARVGDKIYVTGYLGDAALALAGVKGKAPLDSHQLHVLRRSLDFPVPRVEVGIALRGIASAAIDISDGLLADLGHILDQSHVGAQIEVAALPLSPTARQVTKTWGESVLQLALSGGEDYELCFTVSPEKVSQLDNVMRELKCGYTCIGEITLDRELVVGEKGKPFVVRKKGYEHF